ncbi:MAG: response regulator, partial [Desulfobacterales bacterium]|nr:response regulator [Desulfobacterales bacterium]
VRNIDDNCPLVSGDATQIHQVALNLMTNGFHAMTNMGGTLTISLGALEFPGEGLLEETGLMPGQYLCYSVADTGVGISRDNIDKIFDPYFTTKPQGKGTGLGLAVIKGIVENHGGAIHVESRPGFGSLFRVFFPTINEDRKTVPSPGPARNQKGDEHILLVDDQKSVINVERQVLEVLGYKVTGRLSGKDALDTFSAMPDRFDLVVTDMSMPGMTGDELAGKIMQIRPEVPVILLTGYSESIGREKALKMGIRDLLMKPVRLREFSGVIRRELDGNGKN